MNSQKLAVLAVVAIAMVIWATVLTQQSENTGTGSNTPSYLIQGLAVDKISTIEIGKDEDKIILKRQGKQFVATTKDNYPVSVKQVNDLLTKCLDVKTLERISEHADNHADLGVTEDAARTVVRFLQADGEVLTGIVVGDPPEGASGSYVRLVNGDTVYSVERAPWFQDQVMNYLDQELLKVARKDVNAVTVTGPNDTYTLKSGPDGEGVELTQIPEGKQLMTSNARSVLTALDDLRFDDVQKGPNAALKFDRTYVAKLNNDTLYILKIATEDDKTYAILAAEYTGGQVTINPNTKDSEAVLKIKEEKLKTQTEAMQFSEKHKNWIYEIPSWKSQYLTNDLDDIVEDVPEPEPVEDVNEPVLDIPSATDLMDGGMN